MSVELQVLQRIANLKATNGTIAKKGLLGEYLNDPTFLEVTKYALDSRKHYNISELPEFKESGANFTILDVFKYLDYLSRKRGCTDFEREKLLNIACSNRDLYKVTKLIINKTLDCGVGAVTVNDVLPDTVEVFPYMRCSTISKIGNISYPAIVQEKLNGEYIAIIKNGNEIVHRTRNGSYLDLKGRFHQQFMEYEGDNCVFMGEILAVDDAGNYLSRQASNGIMNKAIAGTLSDEEADNMVIVLWDIVSIDEFNDKVPKKERVKYITRFNTLKTWLTNNIVNNVNLVNYKIVTSYEEVIEFFKLMISLLKEGAVLKDFENIFQNTTSTKQVKVKEVKDCDLRMIGWNYGDKDGKYRYCLGSITCATEDGMIVVDIGSGFPDEQRGFLGRDYSGNLIVGMSKEWKEYWDSCINTAIIETEFSEVCKDKKRPDVDSLYLPIYKRVRKDKDVADTTEYIHSLFAKNPTVD